MDDDARATDGGLLAALRARSDDPLIAQAAAQIRQLQSTNRRLHRRVQGAESPLAQEVARLEMELRAVRSVMEAFRRSSDTAWGHTRAHAQALDEALLLAADKEDENPGLGFGEVAEVIGRSISRLYPGGQPTSRIVEWKRNARDILKRQDAKSISLAAVEPDPLVVED